MKHLLVLAITMTLLGPACAFQSSARTPISTDVTTPTAALGTPTTMPTTARTVTPTTTTPNTLGSYDDPHDFHSFAARLDKAIRTADVQFFLDNVVFEDLKCDVDFPAPPKSCSGKPGGATVPGIVTGVWASEGFGLDADGYRDFVGKFLEASETSAFDAYGDPQPQLYAYGVFKPEYRASDVGKETVQAFATRVTSGSEPGIPPPGRSVLIIHVSFDGKRWSIFRLAVTPAVQLYPPAAALLDPSRPEARGMLEYWRRWEPPPVPDSAANTVRKTPIHRIQHDVTSERIGRAHLEVAWMT